MADINIRRFREIGNIETITACQVTHSLAKHVHSNLCIALIETGGRRSIVSGTRYEAGAGQIMVIHPGEVHTCTAADGKPYSYSLLTVDVEKNAELFAEITGRKTVPYCKNVVIDDQETFYVLKQVFLTLAQPGSALEKQAVYSTGMKRLLRQFCADFHKERLGGKEKTAVTRVCDYLAACYAEDISLQQLAQLANFSPYYLHRVFVASTGMPPHAFLNLVRIKQAKGLLLNGKQLAEVAAETGFVDQSHFSRRFKDVVGMTPGLWCKGQR